MKAMLGTHRNEGMELIRGETTWTLNRRTSTLFGAGGPQSLVWIPTSGSFHARHASC